MLFWTPWISLYGQKQLKHSSQYILFCVPVSSSHIYNTHCFKAACNKKSVAPILSLASLLKSFMKIKHPKEMYSRQVIMFDYNFNRVKFESVKLLYCNNSQSLLVDSFAQFFSIYKPILYMSLLSWRYSYTSHITAVNQTLFCTVMKIWYGTHQLSCLCQ